MTVASQKTFFITVRSMDGAPLRLKNKERWIYSKERWIYSEERWIYSEERWINSEEVDLQ